MDQAPVLYNIALRLDNATLSKLINSLSWPALSIILRDQNFWYQRTERLMGRKLLERQGIDWRRVYNTFEGNTNVPEDIDYMFLDYVPAVQVLEELIGPLTRELVDQANVLSLSVLLYLEARTSLDFEAGSRRSVSELREAGARTSLGFEFYTCCLASAAQNGVLELIQPLLDRMLGGKRVTKFAMRYHINSAIRLAILSDRVAIAELLFPHMSAEDSDDILDEAIKKDAA